MYCNCLSRVRHLSACESLPKKMTSLAFKPLFCAINCNWSPVSVPAWSAFQVLEGFDEVRLEYPGRDHAQLTADTWRLAPTFDLAQTKSEREINISPIVVYTATHTSTEERRCSSYVEQVRRRASPWVQFSSRGAAVGMSVGEIICCLTKPIKASTWVFFFRISRGGGLREVRSLRINIRLRCQQ